MLGDRPAMLKQWAILLTVLTSVHPVRAGEFRYPPHNNFERTLDPYDVLTVILLNCMYEDPILSVPTYYWEHNGVSMGETMTGRSIFLRIENVHTYKSEAEGTYTCKVQNRPGSVSYVLKLPVLFEVNTTTYHVTVGEDIAVNCSQTGYVRTEWKWEDTEGSVVSSSNQDRIWTDLSQRIALGKSDVKNHQILNLHIDDIRMKDSGVYHCSIGDNRTDPIAVTVNVSTPAYYGGDLSSANGSVTYEMPVEFRNGNVSFADYTFTGGEKNGKMTGGIGQLVDGEVGLASLESKQGRFPWVGWSSSSDTEIIFTFSELREIYSVTIHTMFSYNGSIKVASFGSIEVSVSSNRQQWTTFTDTVFRSANVTISTLMPSGPPQGHYVRVQLKDAVGSGVVLVSEVSFDSKVVLVTTGAPPDSPDALIGGLVTGGLVIVLLLVIIAVLASILILQRHKKGLYSSIHSNSHRVNATTNSNGQVAEQDEVYSEPDKQRSFTSTSMVKPSVVDLDNFKKMDQNPLYNHPPEEPLVVAEYAEIPRGSSITSTNLPPAPPLCRPGPSMSPTFKPVSELPDSVDTGFNIYSSADNIFQQEEKFEDIYSEPYDLTTFASGGVSGGVDHHIRSPEGASVQLGDDLTPYSSVYAMPAPLDRSEGPMEISSTNIRELKPLGVGQFGEVVLAQTVGLSLKDLKFSETNIDRSVEISVAVKKLKEDSQTSTREAFEKEIKFMSRLSHRNVIRLLAVCLKGTPFIVMEYMEEGDLNQFLKKRKFSTIPSDYSNTLDIRGLLDITTQIASGMEYLASMKFIHRDLATRNCLVGKNLVVKIADFGMSQNLYSAYYFKLKGRAVLPIRWMAYECFYGRFSVKTDVWAYGVTLWEVFTLGQHQPYEGWTDQEVIENSVKPSRGGESKKLDKPDVCPPEVYHLMLKCWCHESENRPTFKEICRVLKTLNVP